ncbi:PucR family transcriptional regulator [Streptomyces caniscabiei]|uniref:PucR family transcriptional regulator n=1 Tax=Streptomyces caniscabiei TaxID=2746961 RepID=UPI0029A43B32|nr:helix-turn-helix domain-containing protein [Streptomyces caniscabiei]MDX3731472.1 helix-turn-helix domain-containing protein [Streptomyces caniscabiei]
MRTGETGQMGEPGEIVGGVVARGSIVNGGSGTDGRNATADHRTDRPSTAHTPTDAPLTDRTPTGHAPTDRAPSHPAPRDGFLDGFERILAEAAVTGRRLTRDEIESRRALGARAAEAGHGWRSLVRAHLVAGRENWPRGADPARVLAVVEQAVDAFADGYERAQRLVVRKEEAARREFIDDLLHGRGDPGQLAARSERFGLRLSRAHAVAVAEGPEKYDETDPVPRQVASDLFARFENRRILFTTKDGRMVCVAPGDQDDVLAHFAKRSYAATGRAQVAIGRSRPGTVGIGHSYEEALNALDVAQRMGLDEPLLRASDLLVFPVLARDRQALVDLVSSTLGPLEHARGGARPLLDTLTAYFDTGCVAASTARRLSLSVRALTYRLARVRSLTGTDPSDPVDRYTLQTAVIGARLLDWPARPLSSTETTP